MEKIFFPSTILAPELSSPSLRAVQALQPVHRSKIPAQKGSPVTQGCHVLPFVQLRYSNLYLEGRNPAAGEERGGKSLSVQLGGHKFKGPDHVKTFCSQTRGGFGGCSWPPDRGCAEGLPAFGAGERFTAKIRRAVACPCASVELSSWMLWFIRLDPNRASD